jgi:hypothetical protein
VLCALTWPGIVAAVTWVYVLVLVLGGLGFLATLVFIWSERGNWGSVDLDSPGLHGLLKGKVKVAGVTVLLLLGSMGGIAWSAMRLTSDHEPVKNAVLLGKVTTIEDLPPNPVPAQGDSHQQVLRKIVGWFADFSDARFVINRGARDGIVKGDWFATVSHPERLKDLPNGAASNLQDDLTTLIRCESVYRTESTCALESWAYDAQLRKCCSKGIAWHTGKPIEMAPYGPVTVGQTVAAVPREEKKARDQLDRWFARASAASGAKRTIFYQEALIRADDFLATYPTGFFAGDVLLIKGDAQAELGHYKAAIASWDQFEQKFPFHPSAGAVDERIRDAEKRLKSASADSG